MQHDDELETVMKSFYALENGAALPTDAILRPQAGTPPLSGFVLTPDWVMDTESPDWLDSLRVLYPAPRKFSDAVALSYPPFAQAKPVREKTIWTFCTLD
jgi:hypothetical protein